MQDYGHIDDLLENDFSDLGTNEHTTFAVTFAFPIESKQDIDDYIDKNGKEALRDILISQITGGEE